MKIIVAEYAVGINDPAYLAEGRAMLMTLVRSFKNTGNDVIYPEDVKDFYRFIEKRSVECDCGLVIAPDEFLYEYTRILEENTTNLGSPSETVKLCADKLSTSFELKKNGIPTPKIYESRGHVQKKKYVVKPRFGCASEDISVTSKFMCKDGFITTEFIQGDHLSVSLVVGTHT
ncbi:MAG: ATP-grasp domain-containing protein, partial [Halobacteriota archaeon]|nr:ATP-grasp domain-containing protein [Halobacteriota archaeon]